MKPKNSKYAYRTPYEGYNRIRKGVKKVSAYECEHGNRKTVSVSELEKKLERQLSRFGL